MVTLSMLPSTVDNLLQDYQVLLVVLEVQLPWLIPAKKKMLVQLLQLPRVFLVEWVNSLMLTLPLNSRRKLLQNLWLLNQHLLALFHLQHSLENKTLSSFLFEILETFHKTIYINCISLINKF